MTYSRLVPCVEVSAESRWVGAVSFDETSVSSFEVLEVFHFVSFKSVTAEGSISSSKEVFLCFRYGNDDLISLMESVSIWYLLSVHFMKAVSRRAVPSFKEVLDALNHRS